MVRHSVAVFKKQIFDTVYNKILLFQFLFYPLFTLLFLFSPAGVDQSKMTIVMLMSAMITGMAPIITINNIIQEDKRIGALRMLILSNVKPFEYLVGVTFYITCLSFVTSVFLGAIAGFSFFNFGLYLGGMLLGIIATVFLGSAMAGQAKNGASASLFVVIISMMNGFVPILATFYPAITNVTRFWYTQAIADIIGDLYDGFYGNLPIRFLTILCNALFFFAFFVVSFKRNKLIDEK